jgi:hypothetical protein
MWWVQSQYGVVGMVINYQSLSIIKEYGATLPLLAVLTIIFLLVTSFVFVQCSQPTSICPQLSKNW